MQPISIRLLILAVVAVLIVIAIFFAYPRVKRFFAIDNCLDSGGAWHNETCVH